MKTFKEFINEDIFDYLSPKNEEDIKKLIEYVSPYDVIYQVNRYKLSHDLYPTDNDIKKYLSSLTNFYKDCVNICNMIYEDIKKNMTSKISESKYFCVRYVEGRSPLYENGILIVMPDLWMSKAGSEQSKWLSDYIIDNQINYEISIGTTSDIMSINTMVDTSIIYQVPSNVDIINEKMSIKNILSPKPKEEIEKSIGNSNLSNNDIIFKVLSYGLSFDLIPRDDEDRCYYKGYLMARNSKLTKLPYNLTVGGTLDCSNNLLTELPKGLIVYGDLYCNNNQLNNLPNDLVVYGNVDCSDNSSVISKPKGAKITGIFDNGFNNESVTSILKPKSDDEITKYLSNMDDLDRIKEVIIWRLPKKYLPHNTKEIIINRIREILNTKRGKMIRYKVLRMYSIDSSYYKNKSYHKVANININGLHIDPSTTINGKTYYSKDYKSDYDIPFDELSIGALLMVYKKITHGKHIYDWDYLWSQYEWYQGKVNEGVGNFLQPKSDDDIYKSLDDMSDLERIHRVRQYNLPERYLPSDDKIHKIIDKMPFKRKFVFIERNKLPERFQLSDEKIREELDKMTPKNRNEFIFNFKLDKFRPKRSVKDRLNNIERIKKFVKKNGRVWNFKSTWILNQIIKDDRYTDILLQSLEKDGVKYAGYIDGIEYPNNFIKYDDLDYSAIWFILNRILKDYELDHGITNENIKDFLQPKSEEEIWRQIGNMNVFDRIEKVYKDNLNKKYFPTKEEIQQERDKLTKTSKHFANICDELFNDLNDKFDDRFFPLKIKLHKHEETYYISIVLSVAWAGRISHDEHIWLNEYYSGKSKEYNIHISVVGDTTRKPIYSIQNDDFPINFWDYRDFPDPLYPERLY